MLEPPESGAQSRPISGAQIRYANATFEQAEACGVIEAMAYRAQAHCFPGWGLPVDRGRYLQTLRTALERGARLSPEWFLDPDICPAPKP